MMILLTGGSACGKSFYAETLAQRFAEPRLYIATMRPYDEECLSRIERHRAMRAGKGFISAERYTDLAGTDLPACKTILLECVCNLTANEMFPVEGDQRDPFDAVVSGVDALQNTCETLIVVTNDVGGDGAAYTDSTRRYIETLGRINAALAERADRVFEMVCGIPVLLKGALL